MCTRNSNLSYQKIFTVTYYELFLKETEMFVCVIIPSNHNMYTNSINKDEFYTKQLTKILTGPLYFGLNLPRFSKTSYTIPEWYF